MNSFIIVLLIINLINRCFIQVFLIAVFLFLNNNKLSSFFDKLNEIKKINQIYFTKEEKLFFIYGKNNMEFEDYCLYLSSTIKNKYEKKFLLELKNCNSKSNIDMLVDSYLLIYQKRSKTIEIINFLTSLIYFVFSYILTYFNKYLDIINIFNIVLLMILLFSYKTIDFQYKNMSFFDRFYCLFFQRLSYMSPMKSLSLTLEEFNRRKNNIFKNLYENLTNKSFGKYKVSEEKQIILSSIYKICYSNKYNKEQTLVSYYEKINKNKMTNLEILSNFIYYFMICLIVILEVFL